MEDVKAKVLLPLLAGLTPRTEEEKEALETFRREVEDFTAFAAEAALLEPKPVSNGG